jgi:hypothetical protein
VLLDGPVLFKSEVNWTTGGPEGLWLSEGILRVPDDRELTESCTKYAESINLSLGMIYTFHISKQERHYNVMWNKLSVTSVRCISNRAE